MDKSLINFNSSSVTKHNILFIIYMQPHYVHIMIKSEIKVAICIKGDKYFKYKLINKILYLNNNIAII